MAGMAMPGWHVMDLGVARLSYNRQGGPSGGSDVESSNWNMIHAQKALGAGRLSLMMMNSLEPATYAKLGSRELFQTGESYRGRPLVDRQHPHDFFMNLSATYRLDLGADSGAWLQVGAGRRAGPGPDRVHAPRLFRRESDRAARPSLAGLDAHRVQRDHARRRVEVGRSGRFGLSRARAGRAPLGHRGREHRFRLRPRQVLLRRRLVRSDLLRVPEEPGASRAGRYPPDHRRCLLRSGRGPSVRGDARVGKKRRVAGWQRQLPARGRIPDHARDHIYGRAELVQKDSTLLSTKEISGGAHGGGADLVRVGAYTAGYLRDFDLVSGLKTGIGADLTIYSFPSSLEPIYGHFPVSVHAFLRLRWGNPHGAGHMDHGKMKM